MFFITHSLIVTGGVLALVALIQALAARGWLPESTLLALAGLLLGASYATVVRIAPEIGLSLSFIIRPSLPAEAYLLIFLPPLLFQAALTADVRSMIPDAAPILLLAVVAVFVATGLIGWSLALVSGQTLAVCLLLGATVATTDPSAVISIFRDLGAPARLTRLVEGESLLNDAAAISIVGVLMGVIGGGAAATAGWGSAIGNLAYGFGAGMALGLAVGRLGAALLAWLDRLPSAAATLTMAIPWPLYLAAEEALGASGVVAVVTAGLVVGAYGPTRLSPSAWRHLEMIWEQIAVLAGAVVFLLAAAQAPSLLAQMTAMGPRAALYLATAVLAALAARATVMFGMFPLLARLGLARPVDRRFKLAIVWGGLRGAVTLVLALALAENEALPEAERRFVAALAAAFVLVSLFCNGLTLRWVVDRLGLTSLTPQQQALQIQAVLLSSAEVEKAIGDTGEDLRLPESAVAEAQAAYRAGILKLTEGFDLESALSERERLTIGLVTLATREHALIPDYGGGVIAPRNLDAMMRNTSAMIDAAREEGRLGYMRAARGILDPTPNYRLALWFARRSGSRRFLARPLADRFELMICRRAVLERLIEYDGRSLSRIVGARMAEALRGVLESRLEGVDAVLSDLRKAFPDHAAVLERRLLMLFALRKGEKLIEAMKAESVVSAEIAQKLEKDLEARWRASVPRPAPGRMP